MTRKNARSGNLAVRRPRARLLRLQESLCAVRCDSKYRYKSHSCFYTFRVLQPCCQHAFHLACNYSMQIWGCQAILGIFNLFFKQREQRRTVRNCAARYGTPCRFSMRKLQQKAPVRGQETRGGDGTFSCSHLGRLRCGERRTAQDGMQDRPDQRRTRMPRAARTSRAASVSAAVGIGVSTVASG